MFGKLIDVLISIWEAFIPWGVVSEYEGGVVLRLGKYLKTVGPGCHFLLPINIDVMLKANVVTDSLRLPPQTVESIQGLWVVQLIIEWRISNVKRFLLETENARNILENAGSSAVAAAVGGGLRAETENECLTAVRKFTVRRGIDVTKVSFVSFAKPTGVFVHFGQAQPIVMGEEE